MSFFSSWFGGDPKTAPFGGSKFPTLDLRTECNEISAYLAERVQGYGGKKNEGPGGDGAVKRIDLGFEHGQGGWVTVVFDTREDAEPDGEWSLHIEANWLQRPTWTAADESLRTKGLRLVLLDGTPRIISPREDFELAVPLGEMLKEVLLRARKEGVFAKLPKRPRCEFGVSHSEGTYGWPKDEDRENEGLI